MAFTEKRRLERYNLQVPARLWPQLPDEAARKLVTQDISSAGAFFKNEACLPIGIRVRLEMMLDVSAIKKLPASHCGTVLVSVTGKIVRSGRERAGIGVRFDKAFTMRPSKE